MLLPVLAFGLAVAGSGWFDRSAEETLDLATPARVLLVNDAGPVRVRSHDAADGGASLTYRDSWLVRRPTLEQETGIEGAVIRLTCATWLPCRSSTELSVPAGTEVVVVSSVGLVEVGDFDGVISVFSTGEGVALGAVSGSIRIVSEGSVEGFSLTADAVEVLVSEGDAHLRFARSPSELAIAADQGAAQVSVPNQRFVVDAVSTSADVTLDLRQSETADRVIVIRAAGPVVIDNESR